MTKDTSWGKVACWYDEAVNNPDSYQQKVILPNLSRILSLNDRMKVVDIACGQGFFGKALAVSRAKIFGVDISPELIEIAKKQASVNEEYFISPADDLLVFKKDFFDAGFSVLAIQNIENYSGVFKEASRVIKKGGKFVLVLNHPSFRIPGESSWEFDEKNKIQYRRINEYLSESRKEIEMYPGKEVSEKTTSFHRPLQNYSKALWNSGFTIARIEEWTSHKKSEPGPRQSIEDRARKEFPLFMCLECVKTKN